MLAQPGPFKQTQLNSTIAAVRGIAALRIRSAGAHPGQQGQHLVDMAGHIDVKLALPGRVAHIGTQHQIPDIAVGDNHTLLTAQATGPADVEKPLDFLIHPADRLHLAMLIDRTGDRQRLVDREVADGRQQRAQFPQRGAVSLDLAI